LLISAARVGERVPEIVQDERHARRLDELNTNARALSTFMLILRVGTLAHRQGVENTAGT